MSVITFVNNRKEETGKTLSLVAIATHMSIEHNLKTLIISTANQADPINKCFFKPQKKQKINLNFLGLNRDTAIDVETGIEGLAKMGRSNKITPKMITNYCNIVFKDRLDILGGTGRETIDLSETYPSIIAAASESYDMVLIDLDLNIKQEIRNQIIEQSNLLVVNLSQRLASIDKYKENKEKSSLLQSPKTLILVGRYDKYSKYNSKNITRYLGEKNQVLTIPYNTLYFEAAEEGEVADIFLRFKKNTLDPEDRNAFFMEEVKRATENIIYRLQVLQTKM